MAGSSSINPSFIVEVGEEYYPYPSHVSSPNLVSVKLSGKDKYKVWKTQMLCLLKSHDMLGFIDGTFKNPKGQEKRTVGDIEAWVRSDALVKSWILGSISEEAAMYVVNHLTSELTLAADFTAKDAWDELQRIYGPAVLQQAAENTLLDLRNLDGSTLLHVAAIVGNTEAVDILVRRNLDLLIVEDNEGQIPLATSLSNMNTETSMCLWDHFKNNIDKYPLFSTRSYDELIVLAISSKDFGLATDLLMVFKNLKSDAVLMAMAQNFPNLNCWERISIRGHNIYQAENVRQRLEELSCAG